MAVLALAACWAFKAILSTRQKFDERRDLVFFEGVEQGFPDVVQPISNQGDGFSLVGFLGDRSFLSLPDSRLEGPTRGQSQDGHQLFESHPFGESRSSNFCRVLRVYAHNIIFA